MSLPYCQKFFSRFDVEFLLHEVALYLELIVTNTNKFPFVETSLIFVLNWVVESLTMKSIFQLSVQT